MYLIPIPAFADSHLWLLHDGQRALQLESILVTHHPADHIGSVDALRQAAGAGVYGPAVHDDTTAFAAIRQWKNQFK